MFEGKPWEHRLTARMLQPALSEMERSREGIRKEVARAYALANRLNRIQTFGPAPRIGIVAAGKTYLDVRQALRTLGLDDTELSARGVRLLRLAMVHPLIAAEVEEFADGLTEIIVVEEKRAFIESAVKEILYGKPDAPLVTGKTDPQGAKLFAVEGELDADLIATGLAARLGSRPEFSTVTAWQARQAPGRPVTPLPLTLPLVGRTPYFCSGCPHNSSTKVPEGSLVGGGIGCHALVLMMEPEAVGDVVGLTQMGGEGAQWIGMAPFMRTRRHLLQNIGDGTFHHSGSLAVRAAIASGVNVTYKLLYNSAVAMTGGQQATGAMSIPALTRMLTAEGVRRIVITTAEPGRYRRRRPRAGRAGLAPGPGRRGPGGAEPPRRGHRADSRSGVRDRASPQAQAPAGRRSGRTGHDQPAGLRGVRRLRREVELPVGPAGRDRIRPQDGHRPVVLQQGLLVPEGRLPVVPDRDSER